MYGVGYRKVNRFSKNILVNRELRRKQSNHKTTLLVKN